MITLLRGCWGCYNRPHYQPMQDLMMTEPKLRKLTPKEEVFAQEMAKTNSPAAAYRKAYDCAKMSAASVSRTAYQVLAKPPVAARIAALRAPVIARQEAEVHMTLEQHLLDLKTIRDAAHKVEQFGAATSAEVARGKASGIHVERTKVDLSSTDGTMSPKPTIDYSKLSKEAMREILAAQIDATDTPS